ncbi:periostin isoform X17 [Xenopus laevis]|uniref:Periostin n=1 Tax=Xenopus laevis TaxID=8355 RepID=A0A8J0UGY3_XENLA|nr:periostin isoform X17 [Xenopus laevis]
MMKGLFLCIFATFLLSAIDQAESNAYYDKILTHSRIRARQQGPNVCALQQVLGTKKKYFSTCKNWYQGAICGKKATVLYECCPGYMKINGEAGCPAVAPIDNVYGTLGIVGATSTQDYSDRSDLRQEIEGIGSYTFFAPSNDAWQLLDSDVRDSLLSNVNIELLNALHYHMINKRMLTKDLKNGLSVTSMFNNQDLIINHYTNGVVTVNCARIIHGNQIATNGVVHVIDRVVTAVGNTIEDFIDSEDELSSFREAGVAAEVLEQLGKSGQYTLFAPTNDAFEKLPKGVLERIMGDKQAVKALVNYHILNSVQCSEAIMGGTALETLEGSSLQIGCDGDSLTVNGIKMVNRKDIVTTNGVIHLIDQVLIPDSAKQVLELAGSHQTTFTDLMAQMGLAASFRPDAEYTLLAPVNNAFSDETLRMDLSLLKLIMQNHILKTKFVLNELYNGQILKTLGGKSLRVFVYRTAVCIENSCMLRGSKEGRNGAIHTFSEIIKPAEKSLYELISLDKRFSIFLNLIEYAGLKDLLSQDGAWTWFIPTNDAFKGLSDAELEILKRDKVALQNILLYHLAPEVFIGGGLEHGVTNVIKSLQGSKIMVKAINNTVSANGVVSKEPDVMTTNGVFHVIDKLLFPADVSIGNEQLLTILNKLIKYFTIKFSRGSKFSEIPLSKYIKTIITIGEPRVTTVTRIIEVKPEIRVVGGETITKVIRGDPSITKITKVIEGDPEFKLIREGETRVTKVIQGEPTITKFTRVIEGEPDLKLIKEGETRVTKVIQGEPITRITKVIEGEPDFRLIKEGETRVTKVIQGEPTLTRITKVIEGEPDFRLIKEGETRVTKVIHGEPTLTRITKVIEGEPDFRLIKEGETRVTKVIQGEPLTRITKMIEGEPDFRLVQEGETRVTKVIQGEPTLTRITKVIEGEPDFRLIKEGETRVTKVIQGEPTITKITRVIEGEPDFKLIKEGETRVTKVIQGEPTLTRITKVIEGEPDFRLVKEGETRVTKVIQGEPIVTKLTRVVEGEPDFKLIKEGETRVTKVIQGGPEITYTRVSGGLDSETDEETIKKMLEGEVTRVTKFIEGDSQILEDDELKMLLQGGTQISKVITVHESEMPENVQISKIIKEPQVRRVQTGRRTQVRRKMRRSHQHP